MKHDQHGIEFRQRGFIASRIDSDPLTLGIASFNVILQRAKIIMHSWTMLFGS